MEILDKIESKTSSVIKYVFRMEDGLITEFSYINKGDGKEIVCVPTQTLCAQGCKFCHVTGNLGKLKLRNLKAQEIFVGVNMIAEEKKSSDCLLVSFMGCGEPLVNIQEVAQAMMWLTDAHAENYETVRFAIATSIPAHHLDKFYFLARLIKSRELKVKFHLSLHYTDDELRSEWMPNALPIDLSVASMLWARDYCGIECEAHYALIEGVNDSDADFLHLARMGMHVKFLYYNEREDVDKNASGRERYEVAESYFARVGASCEYYVPPGLDVGASCGQFLLDYYERYNQCQEEPSSPAST